METYILFFILAGLLIAILVGCSIWSARREKSRIFSNTFSTRPPSTPVSNNEETTPIPTTLDPQGFDIAPSFEMPQNQQNNEELVVVQQQEIQNSVKNIKISLTEQPDDPALATQQPAFVAPQSSTPTDSTQQVEIQPMQQEEPAQPSENNMIILYVVAPEGRQFHGINIVQHLDALGFQYGEYNIFHRHLDNSASPVLFSVANMMQPGVFDLNQMEQFTTVGLVFFMQLPSPNNDLVNLRLLLRTVESFAQSMGGFVLDEQRQLFNDASRQAYLLRVKQA